MAEQVGEISYVVKVDTSGMVTGIKKANDEIGELGKSGDSTSSTMQKLGTAIKAIGVGIAVKKVTSGIISLGKQALMAYADTQQLKGGIETLFKDSADIVIKNATVAFREAGVSANEYMEQSTAFAARLIKDTGGNTKRTAELVDIAIRDMSDNANKMGTSIESIQNAYQGLAKGNATMLDNLKLGYGGTQTEMLKLAQDMGIVSAEIKSFNDMSFEDAIMAIHKLQGELDITGTTSEEAAGTISGAIGMMKASWTDFIAGLADPDANLDELANNLTTSIIAVMDNIKPVIDRLGDQIPRIAEKVADELPKILAELYPVIESIIKAVCEFIKEILPEIMPIIVPVLIEILFAILGSLWQVLVDWFDEIGYNIGVWSYKTMKNFAESVGDWIGTLIANIVNKFIHLGVKIGQIWQDIKDKIVGIGLKIGEAVGGAIKGAINKVLGFAESILNKPIDAINGLINVINAVPGINLGKLSRLSLPRLASGGIVESERGGSVIMAGEAGEDEWVVPESKMASMIEQLQARGFGGSNNITINVEGIWATSESQKRDVAQDIWEKINEINKSRMGAYL